LIEGSTNAPLKEKPDIAILTAFSFFSATDVDQFNKSYPGCMVVKADESNI
jgi:hypothetical protein